VDSQARSSIRSAAFDPGCSACPRLANFLAEVRKGHPGYHARPVPMFGPLDASILVVGLAPGMHGANRTGRPFTGDYAGILLYKTLHKYGLASHAGSDDPADGLVLRDCRITNAVKCLPPQNKPETSEIKQCNPFLAQEIALLDRGSAILALGTIAHQAVLLACKLKARDYPFAHGASHALPNGLVLHDSYHCSRYNTQTRRLTAEMFEAVFAAISSQLHRSTPCPTSTSASPAL